VFEHGRHALGHIVQPSFSGLVQLSLHHRPRRSGCVQDITGGISSSPRLRSAVKISNTRLLGRVRGFCLLEWLASAEDGIFQCLCRREA
jgi:hypothetical protein